MWARGCAGLVAMRRLIGCGVEGGTGLACVGDLLDQSVG
jgi:hypothetical protein